MKRLIAFILLLNFLPAMSQVPVKTNQIESEATFSKSKAPTKEETTKLLYMLTPENPKKTIGYFTYEKNGSNYDEKTKRLIIHGTANPRVSPSKGQVVTHITGPPYKDTYRIDAVVKLDKSLYEAAALGSGKSIPDLNSYDLTAMGPDRNQNMFLITYETAALKNVSGQQTITLFLTETYDLRNISYDLRKLQILLTADYDFELKSISITPVEPMTIKKVTIPQ